MMGGEIDHDQGVMLDALVQQAIKSGVARRAIDIYIKAHRMAPATHYNREPFEAMCQVVGEAYPDWSEHYNGHVALRILLWAQRDHGCWFSAALREPPDPS